MNFSLSGGAIEAIANGDTPQKPIFQVLGVKKISSTVQSSTDRYRLLLSDGMRSHSAMLATQLNKKVLDGELIIRCVIQLNKYICNTIADSKRVIIILEVQLIASGNQVQDKIGNPVPMGQAQAAAAQTGTSQQNGQPLRSTSSPAFRGSTMGGRSTTLPFNAAAEMPKLPTTPGGYSRVFPIASLTPYQNRWTVRARVTNKGNIRHWNNSRGEGCLFSVDLIDDSAEIRATAFNDQCRKFIDMIEVGKVYLISRGTLKTANKQYTSIKNDYEMSFTGETTVELCTEDTADVPSTQFDFKPISQLESIEKDTLVDIIGVCKSFSEVTTIVTRATNKELSKREIHLVDDSEKVVTLTLWGADAEKFDGSGFPVIAVKGARLSDFGGRSLSVLHSSVFHLNPDIPKAHHLKGWYDGEGSTKEISSISEQRSGGGGATNWKYFMEVKKEGLGGGQKPDYFSCKGTVIFIKKDNCMYKACPSAECNKKVSENSDGTFRCEKCAKEYPDYKYRMLLNVNVVDFGDGQWVTCFQDQAQIMLGGHTAEHIGGLKDTNKESEFEDIFREANFKSYSLRMRIKQETYNDEIRMKCSVVDAKPLDYKEYSKKLITDMRNMMSS